MVGGWARRENGWRLWSSGWDCDREAQDATVAKQNLQSFPCAGELGLRDCGIGTASRWPSAAFKSKFEGSRPFRIGPLRRQWKPSLHVHSRPSAAERWWHSAMLITMHTNLQGSRRAGVAAANNPDNPGFTNTTALVDRTTQGPVLVLVLVPHFILESTIHVSYFYVAMGSHCRARILHPAGWSLSPPAIPARQANPSLAKATGHSTETPYLRTHLPRRRPNR